MRETIKPNDIVRHKPTGETWVVCGVDMMSQTLIPEGYPFPTRANIADCELVERWYEVEPQSESTIRALQKEGLDDYVDVVSAVLHGII